MGVSTRCDDGRDDEGFLCEWWWLRLLLLMMMIMMMMNYVQSNLPITRINIVVVFFIVIRTHSPGDVIRHPCRPWHGCWYGRMYCITCNTYMYCDRALWCWHTNKTRSRKSKSSEAEENRFYSDHYSDIDPCGGRTRITVIDCFPLVVEWTDRRSTWLSCGTTPFSLFS